MLENSLKSMIKNSVGVFRYFRRARLLELSSSSPIILFALKCLQLSASFMTLAPVNVCIFQLCDSVISPSILTILVLVPLVIFSLAFFYFSKLSFLGFSFPFLNSGFVWVLKVRESLEFYSGIFQYWKVVENQCRSWKVLEIYESL